MRIYLTAAFLFVTFVTIGQFSDDFSDGNFTTDPTWSGTTANFEIDAMQQLHLVAPAVADVSYLSVASAIADDVTWDCWVRMDFNPSSANYTRVYLMSDQEDLTGSLNGYFVMIGNTADEISLYRQDGLTTTEILDGVDDAVDMGTVQVRLKVTRDAAGNWEVLRDTTGGFGFVSEGTVTDDTYATTAYFGLLCTYTSTRSELFYFDDIGTPFADGTIPEVNSVAAVSATMVDVTFSEPVDPISATTLSNYSVDGGIGVPATAVVDGVDPALVHLTFTTPFTNGTTYNLTVENVEDLGGNALDGPVTLPFPYFVPEIPELNDVIVTEILADPNPVVGLPEVEFFELYNRSDKIFDLSGWTVNDNSTTAVLSTYTLLPDTYVVICSPGDGALFGIENVLETAGLPTLTNTEDDVVLKDNTGTLIDSVHYHVDWYNDDTKDNGGWTLERKHLNAPCSDQSNWGASVNPLGGTPGTQNSIWTDEPDNTAPVVSAFELVSDEEILITWNEYMNTEVPLSLSLDPSVGALTGTFLNNQTYQVDVLTLEPNQIYTLELIGGADCWGNAADERIQFGIPEAPEAEDVILNEILFNPLSGGTDYVELYNRSSKIIDLQQLFLANWDDDTIANFKQVSEEQRLLLPEQYVVVTEDSMKVINDFSIYGIGTFVETDLPTYSNDSGTVFLFGPDDVLLDFFHYDADFHYALLNSDDGKALERINFGGGMNNPDNWHTAAEGVEWGTPGYKNSQFFNPNTVGDVSLDPRIFSPDNDGYKDVLLINFDLADVDNVVDIIVYDNQGRPIRQLKDNFFIGQQGAVNWDGTDDHGAKAAIGTYVVWVSVKNVHGDVAEFKLVAVLAGQL